MKIKKGFTLAEVLITLGIIGIVAAMTLPAIIAQHQKVVLVTRLKKNYSVISQALVSSFAENGDYSEWDLGTDYNKANLKRVVDRYLLPYFKVVKIVDVQNITTARKSYGFVIGDGTTLLFSLDGNSNAGNPPGSLMITADFSGRGSIANTTSLDYSRSNFDFRIDRGSGKLRFFGWGIGSVYAKNREELINHPDYGCNYRIMKHQRLNCGALIMMDGWQIKADYPW